jgi:2-polyprenyl-3-methyl-5-hydroxy-6-metoxy-1,4-benzoquinol methylase
VEQTVTLLETLSHCPVCSGFKFKHFISAVDHTVSHETFQIMECETCGFKFTNPRPTEETIVRYYQSADYISHSNTSKGVINFLYKVARKSTISKKINLVKSINPNGKTILDYGCGTGEFLFATKKSGWETKGIEPNNEAKNFAINNYLLEVFSPADINNFPEESFDVITLWHVLEHVHKLNETIEILKKILNQHGRIIIAVPNSNAYESNIYNENWAAYDLPRHLYHFSSDSLTRLFQKHQMKLINTLSMPLDAFYVAMLSEKYSKNSFGFVKGVFNGVMTNLESLSDKNNSSSLIFILAKS